MRLYWLNISAIRSEVDLPTVPQQVRLFRKFQDGDMHAFADLIDAERLLLYDYLMRMTGEVSRSADTVDEVVQSLTDEILEDLSDPLALRLILFSTARRFAADIWNAETPRLVNASLEQASPTEQQTEDFQHLKDLHAYRALDKALRHLVGREREVVTLRSRCSFEFHHIAELMTISTQEAEQLFLDGMQKIDAECSGAVVGPELALQRMPGHPLPDRVSQATMNLSMVMEGIKTKPVGLRSPLRIAVFACVILVAAAYFLFPEIFQRLLGLVF